MKIAGYTIRETLHRGKHAAVYRVLDEKDGKSYILKSLTEPYGETPASKAADHEYRLLGKIESGNVIKIHCRLRQEDRVFLLLEDIGGKSLKELLKDQSPLPIRLFLEVALAVTAGLADLHKQNIIHKDLNPTNIILNPETHNLRIIDFNIAVEYDVKVSYPGNPERLAGTLPYISPEQTGRMNSKVDQRSDLYSLGVTFYEMLTGKLPFPQRSPMEILYSHLARRPQPPHLINKQIPGVLAKIILKLMAKKPEERYQSAAGLKYDLERFQEALTRDLEEPGAFTLGSKDFPGKLQVPAKLYGREKEIESLLAAYRRMARGAQEMILVTGGAGTGKSALVNEIPKHLSRDRGYFINGKFESLQGNIPYFGFIQAINRFCDLLLTQNEAVLIPWQQKIREAVGDLGKVLTDIIPHLEAVIGKQPGIPPISGAEAKNRFDFVFQRFMQAISGKEHPLVMFLDDLQWADTASLELIKSLMSESRDCSLVFIGAYRDNEVPAAHLLNIIIEELRKQGVSVSTIPVKNLTGENIQELLTETLRGAEPPRRQDIRILARHIHGKTHGNAFFTHQFLENLYKENLLHFDFSSCKWYWEIDKINRQAVTDNVVELLVHRIQSLPAAVQEVLKIASCAGNLFDTDTLSLITGKEIQIKDPLEIAVKENLLYPPDDSHYQFTHDRIRQAAYSLVSVGEKKPVHLKIGRLLLKEFHVLEGAGAAKVNEAAEHRLFDIVNHFNNGIDLVTDAEEKNRIIRLNLKAAQKARAAAAYQTAWEYSQHSLRLLPGDGWQHHYELTLSVYREAIEAAYLSGNYPRVKQLGEPVLKDAAKILDKTIVYEYRLMEMMAQNQFEKVVEYTLELINSLGIAIPRHPSEQDNMIFMQTRALLEKIGTKGLEILPPMKDEKKQLAMRLYVQTSSAFGLSAIELYPFMVNKMLLLSLENGQTPETLHLLTEYGILEALMGNFSDAFAHIGVALTLLDKLTGFDAMKVKIMAYSHIYILHWKIPYKELARCFWEIYQKALRVGHWLYAAFCLGNYLLLRLYTGSDLEHASNLGKTILATLDQVKQPAIKMYTESGTRAIENLRIPKEDPTFLDIRLENFFPEAASATSETKGFKQFYEIASMSLLQCIFEQYHPLDCSDILQQIPLTIGLIQYPNYIFYSTVIKLQVIKTTSPAENQKYMEEVLENLGKIEKWAGFCPGNFQHRYYLLRAELSSLNRDNYRAAEYYDQAINAALENEFPGDEALFSELTAKFYLQQQREPLAAFYFQKACWCYRKWGAAAKVKQMELNYPKYLSMIFPGSELTGTGTITSATDTTDELLDVKSIIKASQTLASQVQLKPLLEEIIPILIENAGAQKSVLIENIDDCLLIQAEGTVDGVTGILQRQPLEEPGKIPLSVINYVARSKQQLVFDNVAKDPHYAADPYIREHQTKSAAGFPILIKGKLAAIIYLENNLVEGAFTPARLKVINTLSSQIAISLENARVYRDLAELNKSLEQKVADRTRQLEEMDKAKSRFFANISHEFRTPLTLIMGPLEQMLSTVDSDGNEDTGGSDDAGVSGGPGGPGGIDHAHNTGSRQDRDENIRMALRNAQRLLELINQLLDLSRLDSGKMQLHAARQNIIPFLKALAGAFDSLARHKKLALSFYSPQEDMTLYYDAEKLEKVIINLIANAMKFTPPGGEVRVTAALNSGKEEKYPAGYVEIGVQDTGIGIGADQLPYVFDRFYQAGSSSRVPGGGTGIGLALVKELVELHHGEITVQSALDKGSRFSILLPLGTGHLEPGEMAAQPQPEPHPGTAFKIPSFAVIAPGGPAEPADPSETAEAAVPLEPHEPGEPGISTGSSGEEVEISRETGETTARKKSARKKDVLEKDVVLVVEDHPDVREYLRGPLAAEYRVVEALDGQEGIDKAGKIIPDLIVSDVMMPRRDGFQLCQALKKDVKTSHIPIILLTAKASEDSVLEGFETGADDYITKPFNTKILLTRIKNLIHLRRRLQETIQREMLLQPTEIAVSSIDREFMKELKQTIEKNLGDMDFGIDELARSLYMSRTHLNRKVKALTGESPNQFIQSFRLKRAAQLLKANFGNVTEVAFEVGFTSSNYFTRCFKEKFQQLPGSYSGE